MPNAGATSSAAKPTVATTSPTRTTTALDERAATSSATTEPTPASSTTMRSRPLTASSSSDHFSCTWGRRVVREMKSRPWTKKAVPAASRARSREEDSARSVTVGHTVGRGSRRQASGRVLRSAAGVAAPVRASLAHRDSGDDERGDGIEPPPAEEGIGEQADEEHGREVGAEQRLGAVGDDRPRPELAAGASLPPREHGHDDERQGGERDADDRGVGLL